MAVAFSSFDTLLAPFVKCDNLNYDQVKQSLQNYIYSVNSNSRCGAEAAFSNITLDLTPPEDLLNNYAITGKGIMDFTYKECQKEMDMINRAFCELMIDGDAKHIPFSYPIPTYNIHKRFDWDNPNNDLLWDMSGKYGYPYFANYINSDMKPEDSRSMCPLSGDTKIISWSEKLRSYTVQPINTLYQNIKRDKKDYITTLSNGKPIKCKINRFDETATYTIRLVNGAFIKTTGNHLNKVYGKDYLKTTELTENDYLPYYIHPMKTDGELSYEEGKLVGMFLGDGSYKDNNCVVFSLNKDKKQPLISFLNDIIPNKFGGYVNSSDLTSSISGKQSCVNVVVNSKYVRGLIEDFVIGNQTCEKSLNYKALTQSIDFKNGIIDGLYMTDGGNSNRIYTSSKDMVTSITALLATMGIVTNITEDNREGRLSDKPCYTLRFYSPQEMVNKPNIYIKDDEYLWVKIKSITQEKQVGKSYSYCLEIIDRNIEPVFTLANGIVTHNCRLRLDLTELRKRNGGLFGSGDSTGSIGVVTINLPLIAYEHKNDTEGFYAELNRVMDVAKESLEIKRKWLQENIIDTNMIPAFNTYVGTINNHFSTIGIVGMNEMCENFFDGKHDILDDEGKEFAVAVGQHFREKLIEYQQETGNLYNFEATPAESTAYRLALRDKAKYPDIITRGTDKSPYYTNSCHIPVNKIKGIKETFDHQEDLQVLFTGGTVIHIFVQSAISGQAAKDIINTVCQNYKVPYVSISPLNRYCPDHGYIADNVEECPICGKTVKKYQRITGYLRCVDNFNDGKKAEFNDRVQLNIDY